MSLGGALQIGRSALLASQAAIQVAGNNLANVATKGYHRQNITLEPTRDERLQQGVFVGRGVQVQAILRQVDQALESRLRGGIADESASLTQKDVLTQIQAVQNELSDNDLSSHLSQFFNAWSDLANRPLDNALRSLVVQQGRTLASFIRSLNTSLVNLRVQVDQSIDESGRAVDDLLTRIEQVNQQIAQSEAGSGGAHSLRDQRDLLLGELAQYMDISVVEQPSGIADVYVGSTPIILNGQSRGVEVRRTTVNGQLNIEVALKADGTPLLPGSGKLGALLSSRFEDVQGAIDTLDEFANQLIFQVNKVHSQGQGTVGFGSVTGLFRVADPAAALNSADADLPFTPTHGSFEVHVTQKSTGQRVTQRITVDLDGINPAADTTLNSLAADLDALANIGASVTADGRLALAADSGDFEITFSNDSSGVLAALGINAFFSGTDASDIDVNSAVAATPGLVAAGQEHVPGDNRNALALAALRDQGLDELGGLSLLQTWNRHVEDYAIRLGQATQQNEANTVVRESLEAQQQSVSGVNIDEEAINLLAYQRAYQASARFLTVVDQMMQTLLELV